jgi:hypothetical protein
MDGLDSCWIYQGECLRTPPLDYYGFVYKITDPYGKIYIGKKAFSHNQKKKISKKVRKVTKTRKRVERIKKDSGWLGYYGSSKPLLEMLEQGNLHNYCKREIVKLCENRQSLAYWEMAIMVQENVLFRDDCWNGNISGKFFKGKIHL